MHLGATLRLLRTDAGMTLRVLAERIGVSTAYLSRVENGHDAPPTPERLEAIAQALGLPAEDLLELAQRVSPVVSDYLDHVPTAGLLYLDIARRRLNVGQLARLKAFIDGEFSSAPERAKAPRLSPLVSPRRIVVGLACETLADLIDVAATRLARSTPGVTPRELANAITAREQVSSSAVGGGVIVPHAVLPGATPSAAIVTLAPALRDSTPDGAPLRVAIVFVHPPENGALLQLLAHVSRLAHHQLAHTLCETTDVRASLEELEALCT